MIKSKDIDNRYLNVNSSRTYRRYLRELSSKDIRAGCDIATTVSYKHRTIDIVGMLNHGAMFTCTRAVNKKKRPPL